MTKKANKAKSFILRIDADTMDAIEKWAADEFRSTNGQLQWIITEALRKSHRLPRRLRESSSKQAIMVDGDVKNVTADSVWQNQEQPNDTTTETTNHHE